MFEPQFRQVWVIVRIVPMKKKVKVDDNHVMSYSRRYFLPRKQKVQFLTGTITVKYKWVYLFRILYCVRCRYQPGRMKVVKQLEE